MADVVRATMDELSSKNELSSEVELEAVWRLIPGKIDCKNVY